MTKGSESIWRNSLTDAQWFRTSGAVNLCVFPGRNNKTKLLAGLSGPAQAASENLAISVEKFDQNTTVLICHKMLIKNPRWANYQHRRLSVSTIPNPNRYSPGIQKWNNQFKKMRHFTERFCMKIKRFGIWISAQLKWRALGLSLCQSGLHTDSSLNHFLLFRQATQLSAPRSNYCRKFDNKMGRLPGGRLSIDRRC